MAKWIMDNDFAGLKPINVFHKQDRGEASIEHREDLKNRHMLIRKGFICKEDIEKAYIYITADDYYKLYINGKFIGQGPAPAYHFHYNYNKYDISEVLQPGENIIAVHVYYQGLVNRVWNSGDYRMGMCAVVELNGSAALFSDETWKYTVAKEFIGKDTIGYETQYAEDIDNRKKLTGWKDTEFVDTDWSYVSINASADYTFYPQITDSVQVYTLEPAKITKIEEGNYIVDFGEELTGRLLLSAEGDSGTVVELRYGEELEENGDVKSNMRCNCNYNESWILSGKNDTLEQYDYKAFRYAQIIYKDAIIDMDSITVEVRHYPFDDAKWSFETSDDCLNKVWKICSNAIKYATQEGYLDCPSREKGQYLGDVTVTAQAHAYLTGDYSMFKKCLTDFSLSSKICPGVMATAPGSWMQEIADYSLQWPLQLLKYYYLSGDREFVEDMLPTAQGILDYFAQYTREDGLIENFKDKPVMVDWPSNLRDNYDYKLMPDYQDGCNAVLNAFYIGAIQAVNQIKQVLDIPHDTNAYENIKKSFANVFYDETTGLITDAEHSKHSSLHANALTLFFNILPGDLKEIINFIKRKRLRCGVYFSYFVLKALSQVGEYDFVYGLLTAPDTWGNMIVEGATTCFEAWGKTQKWNTSLCHPWASSPVIIMIEDIIGIKITKPGWERVEFESHLPKTLKEVNIAIPTIKGSIRLSLH